MIFANDLLTEPNHKNKTAGKTVQKQYVNFYYAKILTNLLRKLIALKLS